MADKSDTAIAAPGPIGSEEQPKDTAATPEKREEAGQSDRRRPLSEQLAGVAHPEKEGLTDELDMLGDAGIGGFSRVGCTCRECRRGSD